MKNDQAGLYIHIPFCLRKCGYCSFYSIVDLNLIPQYIEALQKEMEFYSTYFNSFDTIYLGGGTPSLITSKQLEIIFTTVNKYYKIDRHAEITIEVNPGDVSLSYLRSLRSIGINRLNIGIQSFSDRLLRFLGRRHSASDSVNAIDYARAAGFVNIGIDLIYGVHGQDISMWKDTIQQAMSFVPEHISCYQLSLDSKTPLYKKYIQKELKPPSVDEQLEYFLETAQDLENAGYLHYEVSNFARSQDLCSQHNMKYWRHIPYLGLGPGAHSFIDNERWWNSPAVKSYLEDIETGKRPIENSEELTLEQLQLEALFLGLRMKAGIDLELYKTKYGIDLVADRKSIIDKLIINKLLELDDVFLRPTLSGMAVADSLALI
jgi:oxygen-independent coproporphyrinogen III oxidase